MLSQQTYDFAGCVNTTLGNDILAIACYAFQVTEKHNSEPHLIQWYFMIIIMVVLCIEVNEKICN